MKWDICNVSAKDFERNCLGEFSLEFVRECSVFQTLFHHHFVWISSPHFGKQSILPHDSLYLFVVHLGKPHLNASPTICTFSFVKNYFNCQVVIVVLVLLA